MSFERKEKDKLKYFLLFDLNFVYMYECIIYFSMLCRKYILYCFIQKGMSKMLIFLKNHESIFV